MMETEGRAAIILRLIVEEYIGTGEPVGSRTLAKKKDVNLSAASIRNIMSDLTEAGYITQPHVSAGRIPTDQGYRVYVNSMLLAHSVMRDEQGPTIEALLRAAGMDIREALKQSSSLLAGLSKQAGVVTVTAFTNQTFKSLEFIKVAENRVVVVLVSTSGYVQNKMIFDEDNIEQETLERYSRYINDLLQNLDLDQAREVIERQLQEEKTIMDTMLAKALRLGHMVLAQESAREVFIEGQTNIIHEPEFSNIEQLKALMLTFEEKTRLLKILDKTLQAEGIQILIGSEHGLDEIEACSIVAYPIRTEDSVLASISVIGPKRMDYVKVVPVVITTGRVLTQLSRGLVEHPV
jgi:heat-inducible transcriptional repressor